MTLWILWLYGSIDPMALKRYGSYGSVTLWTHGPWLCDSMDHKAIWPYGFYDTMDPMALWILWHWASMDPMAL